jgi:hypothetical protein
MIYDCSNYVILFKGMLGRQDYRALYAMTELGVQKIHGHVQAPMTLTPDMIESYYRYNSGAKEFSQLGG